MPRGKPAAGVRKTYNWYVLNGLEPPPGLAKPKYPPLPSNFQSMVGAVQLPAPYAPAMPANQQPIVHIPKADVSEETEEQILLKLKERFDILETLSRAALFGDARSVIVSGPPGLGKSFTVEAVLKEFDPDNTVNQIVKGYVKATGLFRLLWQTRRKGQVLVFDDADSVFYDDTCLNFLKSVCDTTEKRSVSYHSEYQIFDEIEQVNVPKTFEYEGTVIFISNLDFDEMISKGHRLAVHLQALISRSHYIDLQMKTKKDYLVRIKQVVEQGMLQDLEQDQRDDVMNFITENQDTLRELSLRMAIKLASIRKMGEDWERLARITCCKQA